MTPSVLCEHYEMELYTRFRFILWTVDQVVLASENGTLLGSLIHLGFEEKVREKLLQRGPAPCVRQPFLV